MKINKSKVLTLRYENMKFSSNSGAGLRELYQSCYKIRYMHTDQQDRNSRDPFIRRNSVF